MKGEGGEEGGGEGGDKGRVIWWGMIGYFAKGLFPSSNFPSIFSQLATITNVQFPKRQLPKSVLAAQPLSLFCPNNYSAIITLAIICLPKVTLAINYTYNKLNFP